MKMWLELKSWASGYAEYSSAVAASTVGEALTYPAVIGSSVISQTNAYGYALRT